MMTVKEIALKMQITGSIAARSAFSKERNTYPAPVMLALSGDAVLT